MGQTEEKNTVPVFSGGLYCVMGMPYSNFAFFGALGLISFL